MLEQALKARQVHFVISDPISYIKFEHDYKVSRIATLVNNQHGKPVSQLGVVYITYAGGNAILKLEDLRGKTYATHDVMKSTLWWIQKDQLEQQNLNPIEDFKSVRTYDSAQAIVLALIAGKIDAAAVKAGTVEDLVKREIIKGDSIRYLKVNKSIRLPFKSSSALYPEWPVARAAHLPDSIAKQVAIALFQLKPDASNSAGSETISWTLPRNYQSVQALAKKMNLPPYANYSPVTLSQVLTQYWYWIAILLSVILVLTIMSIRMRLLNRLLVKTQRELKENNDALIEIASRDALTKLSNRRKLDENLTQEWWRACRDQKPISAILIDIDHFKEYNDFNGHLAGDACLVKLSEIIENTFKRAADIKARYGGDEFVVILPDTAKSECETLAKSLKNEVDQYIAQLSFDSKSPLSLSLGVATIIPEQNTVPDSLIAAADSALYHSKSGGRNRIYVADESEAVN